MVTLEGVEGAAYEVRREAFDDDEEPPLNRMELVLPESIINDYGDRGCYARSLRPLFDALWNASGYAEAQTRLEHGWIDGRQFRRSDHGTSEA